MPDPIVIVVGKLTGGGQERVIVTLANAWARQGRNVTMLVIEPGAPTVPEYVCDPRVQRIYLRSSGELIGFAQRLRQYMGYRWVPGRIPFMLLKRLRLETLARWYACAIYDVRNGHRIKRLRGMLDDIEPSVILAFGIFANLHSLFATKGRGIKVVISERNDPERKLLPFPVSEVRQICYNTAAVVTANSDDSVAKLARYVDAHKLVNIPNPLYGADLQIDDQRCLRVDAPTILISARLVPQKNHRMLLDAFARLPRQLSRWRLAVIGEGVLTRQLQEYARQLRIDDRVDWYGHVVAPQAFYAAADMFVLPSLYEGQPNALLEAMYARLPVIVSDIPCHAEMVEHDQNGLRVSLDDVDSLVEAIVRLADDPCLRERLSENAGRYVQRHHVDNILPEWDRVLSSPR